MAKLHDYAIKHLSEGFHILTCRDCGDTPKSGFDEKELKLELRKLQQKQFTTFGFNRRIRKSKKPN